MQKNHDITKLSAERFCAPPQRVEKGVNSEKRAVLHAEETSRNRAEFHFLASGCRTTVLPPSKKRKAQMAHEHLVRAPFNWFYTYYLFAIKLLFCCFLFFLCFEQVKYIARFSRLYRQSAAERFCAPPFLRSVCRSG